MSRTKRPKRSKRNPKDGAVRRQSLAILMGRFRAEVAQNGDGHYLGTVYHDENCEGLRRQSLLECQCRPEITIKKAG
ncbi:MAG TPA: hypothetical protein VFA32_21260 [Dehalococcoidia bacterium]|jgi:hypothetical protein|nr:hypothetical protein [Dehalococcoidia bacterium]